MQTIASINLSQVDGLMVNLGDKQHVFALAVALTRTARDVKAAQREQLSTTFDRPTPYTLNSLYTKPATKADLEARVWFKDASSGGGGTPATDYLLPQVLGGGRDEKKFERALTAIGALPVGYKVEPARDLPRDAYGNVPRGVLGRIVAAIKAPPSGRTGRASGASQGYFVAKPGGHLHPGVYQKFKFAGGSSIKPVLIFVSAVNYRARYDFAGTAQATVDEVFAAHFDAALAQALGTAR
jgi:hypothetical protein